MSTFSWYQTSKININYFVFIFVVKRKLALDRWDFGLTIVYLSYKALYTIAPLLVVSRVIPRTPVMQTGIVFSVSRDRKSIAHIGDAHNAIAWAETSACYREGASRSRTDCVPQNARNALVMPLNREVVVRLRCAIIWSARGWQAAS